jgi:hypothetical protein
MTIIYLVASTLAGKHRSDHAFSQEEKAKDYAKTIMRTATDLLGRGPFKEMENFDGFPWKDYTVAVWLAGEDSVTIRIIKFDQTN